MSRYLNFSLNEAQAAVVLAIELQRKKEIYLEWGRGAGKSFMLGYTMLRQVQQMHGASFSFVGSTYQKILSNTWPSSKRALEKLNIFQDIDYVVGKNGKKLGFKEPIYSPDKWDNVIHWSNGSTHQLVALDSPNSGRGLNSFGEVGDEAALFDEERLYYNVKATNRAKEVRFEKKSLYGAKIYASSTPITKKGKWFTDKEEYCMREDKRLTHAFIKATAQVNMHNLRQGWWEEAKEEAPSDIIYEAEYLNIRPKEILHGFYPHINKKNYYTDYRNDYLESIIGDYTQSNFDCRQDNDIVMNVPLILSIDWGLFLSATVSQNLQSINEYKTLKEFWVKSPSDIEDLLNDFADYYETKAKKILHLYYGHDGNALKRGGVLTYGDEAAKLLEKRGWVVIDKSKGRPPARHNDKYLLTNILAKETRSSYPVLRINESNCPDLLISIERAEAKEGKNGIEKVKKDEANASMKQQHTTHLSDAWDIPIYDLFNHLLQEHREHLDLPLTT